MKVEISKYAPDVNYDLINKEKFLKVVDLKNKIDTIENKDAWNFYIKLTNTYENVPHLDKKKKISRAFYKLMEINERFDLLNENIKTCGFLCESPGGFIECINNKLKDVNMLSQSLKESECKYNQKIKSICKITYGYDNTGDITKKENILDFIEKSKELNYCDYITADGGFDVSSNYLKQEQLSFKMIFCEFVTALGSLNKNGNFVCKIFDTYTDSTCQLIYIMTYYFEKVFIYKPKLSRPCNSEKYIICKNFKGISQKQLNEMIEKTQTKDFVKSFCIKLPINFKSKIKENNYNFINKQIISLKKVHNMYKNRHFINKIKISYIQKNNEKLCKDYLNEHKII